MFATSAVCLVGLPAGLLLAELLVRVTGLKPARYSPPQMLTYHDGEYRNLGIMGELPINGTHAGTRPSRHLKICGEFIPGALFKGVYASDPRGYFNEERAVEYRINALGLRGPEVKQEKPADVFRIVGLGDSFTFGLGVWEKDTYLRQLETLLRQGDGNRRQFEVINAAVPGYDPFIEVVYLRTQWLELRPDLVVMQFYLNDAYDFELLPGTGDSGVFLKQPEGLAQYSQLWDLIQHGLTLRSLNREIASHFGHPLFQNPEQFLPNPIPVELLRDPSSPVESIWLRSKSGLEGLAETAQERGFKTLLVIFPELYKLDDDHPLQHVYDYVAREAGSCGIPVLNLFETYKGRAPESLWVHPSDHHPNETAHRLAAEAIKRHLLAHHLLDPG